jgi:hypothetical protein
MLASQFDVEFRKDGSIHDRKAVDALIASLGGLTDLLVISHGWNNDKAEATSLYDAFLDSVEEVAKLKLVPGLEPKKLGVLRVYWPSKKFADSQLIPGGGAAGLTQAQDPVLLGLIDELKRDPLLLGGSESDPSRDAQLERAKELVPKLRTVDGQRDFVSAIRAVLVAGEQHPDDGSAEFFSLPAEQLFTRLKEAIPLVTASAAGGATSIEGGAAGLLGDLFDDVTAAARRIANYATYYQMKARAGLVGRNGLADVLNSVRTRRPELPLHLVGHSFGGRVVTAAAAKLPANSPAVTMLLLQAAYSHNGLAAKFDGEHDGAFRTVLADRRVSGPVLITHTKNDRAVGIAYPIASRIAHDAASALGDANDPYGGMGRNGAQHSDAVPGALKAVPGTYDFTRNRVYNLLADRFISGHSDVTGFQVAQAFLRALAVS